MSISEKVTRLTTARNNIRTAINAKGGSASSHGFEDFASDIGGISTKEAVTWHQCPLLVRNYLDEVTYDPTDYTTSQIASYAPSSAVSSNAKPIGKIADGVTYYNEIPNVDTPFASTNSAGTVKPLDSLRWINTPYAPNVRDIGGWSCDGGTVKYGMLFRGGQIKHEVGNDDRPVLVDECGVMAELNLRGKDEADYTAPTSSPLGEDILYFVPDHYQWYTIDNKSSWRETLRFTFDNVLHNRPVYAHCSAGADRIGTFVCVIEALLGVSQSDIDKDYELTCFWSGTSSATSARRRDESDWTGLITMIKAVPLEGGLTDTFHNRVISFVLSLGFTADEINAFRAAMIDGNPAAITVSMDSYSVTKNGSHVTYDNASATVDQYQSYEVNLEPDAGYVIDTITVTMDGIDITSQVFSGERIPFGTESIAVNGDAVVEWKQRVSVNVPGGIPIDISTDAGMTAVLIAGNVGKAYRFTGTTGTYKSGDIYIVEES